MLTYLPLSELHQFISMLIWNTKTNWNFQTNVYQVYKIKMQKTFQEIYQVNENSFLFQILTKKLFPFYRSSLCTTTCCLTTPCGSWPVYHLCLNCQWLKTIGHVTVILSDSYRCSLFCLILTYSVTQNQVIFQLNETFCNNQGII